MNNQYEEKQIAYFSNVRHDLIHALKSFNKGKVLEIGAGGGDTLIEIKKQNLASEVVGIELNQIAGSNQSNENIDRFIFGNIETMDISLPHYYFDVVLCGDVLEHLIDPWNLLQKVEKLIKQQGVIIISCPNIRHLSALTNIYLKGRFDYKNEGLFDKTHLRFFCKRNLQEMVANAGFNLLKTIPSFALTRPNKAYYINRLTLKLFEEFMALQFIVVARKK